MATQFTSTPILDREVPLAEHGFFATFSGSAALLSAILSGSFWLVLFLNREAFQVSPLCTIMLMIVAFFPSCLCHETSHALAATLVGHRVTSFLVRPMWWLRVHDRFELIIQSEKIFSGGILVTPPAGAIDRRSLFLIYAAGPIFSMGEVLLLLLTFRYWLHSAPQLFLPFLFVAVSMLLSSLLPMESGSGGLSDGARIFTLLRRERGTALCAFFEFTSPERLKSAPSLADERLITLAVNGAEYPSDLCRCHRLAYLWAMKLGKLDRAGAHLESALSVCGRMPRKQRAELYLYAALHQLMMQKHTCAKAWIERAVIDMAKSKAA